MHEECLRDSFTTRAEWLDLKCLQCKHEYYGQFGVELATLALSRVREESGEESITHFAALENLAHAFARVRNHQKQRELLEGALSMKEQAYGPELKGSIGEGPNHSNHSNHSNSFVRKFPTVLVLPYLFSFFISIFYFSDFPTFRNFP